MQYTENFFKSKNRKFYCKKFDVFNIFAQNIDYGYTLEPPRRGGSNEYPQSMFWIQNNENRNTPVNPILLYKSGVKWDIHYMDMFS